MVISEGQRGESNKFLQKWEGQIARSEELLQHGRQETVSVRVAFNTTAARFFSSFFLPFFPRVLHRVKGGTKRVFPPLGPEISSHFFVVPNVIRHAYMDLTSRGTCAAHFP